MNPIAKRKIRQGLQRATDEQFWKEMNVIHSQAYYKAVEHYTQAAEIVLTPKLQKQLHEKAGEIRELWDGLNTITIEDTEYDAIYGRKG